MNRNTIIFMVGFAFVLLSILPPLLRGEFGYTGSLAERFTNYPPEPMWEVGFILLCNIIGLSLVIIASLKDEKEVSEWT